MKFSKETEEWFGPFFAIYTLPLWMDLAGSGGGADAPEGALLAGGFLYRKSRFSYV